jgi:hypothetical protein
MRAMPSAKQTARQRGNRGNVAPVPSPGAPDHSGYAEPTRAETTHPSQPDPDAAGNRAAQVAASRDEGGATSGHKPRGPATPGEPEEPALPGTDEPTPPGEHKREPIDDPDPADTKLHVQQSSR